MFVLNAAEIRTLVSIETLILFALISQFLDERHNIIFRGQAGVFCFSGHFLLKHLHSVNGRIDDADSVSLNDESDPITA